MTRPTAAEAEIRARHERDNGQWENIAKNDKQPTMTFMDYAVEMNRDRAALLSILDAREVEDDGRTVREKIDAHKQPFEKYPTLAAEVEYLANKMHGISLQTWSEFLAALNTAILTAEAAPASEPANREKV